MSETRSGPMPQNWSSTRSWFVVAANLLHTAEQINVTEPLNAPTFRSDLHTHYPLILLSFGSIIILGTVLNILEICVIFKNRLFTDMTYVYFLNLAITDVVKCNVTIPFSVMALLYQNWTLGEFLCYFLPMLQDVPAHVTVLSLLMISLDRFLYVRNPSKRRLPAIIFASATWLTAICIVLPYPIFTTYVNLEKFVNVSHTLGSGICLFGIEQNLNKYSFIIFLTVFVFPLVAIAALFMAIFPTLEDVERMLILKNECDIGPLSGRSSYAKNSSRSSSSAHRGALVNPSALDRPIRRSTNNSSINTDRLSFNPTKEKRLLFRIVFIVAAFTVCFGPLNCLSKVIFLGIHETYDIAPQMDKLFVMGTIVAFLPTIITPLAVLTLQTYDHTSSYLSVDTHRRDDECFEMEQHFLKKFPQNSSVATLSTDGDVDSHRTN